MLTTTPVPTTKLPGGELIPVLGQGTWHLAENPRRRAEEVSALRLGLDLGMTLVDTAEMYADGEAEELVREAIGGRRAEVFLVSKVLPENATQHSTVAACHRSLRRLGTDRLDLYLLHWRGSVPLQETLAGFQSLVEAGAIRHWGVSNFDFSDMRELLALSGQPPATDQVLYNLTRRGIEYDLLPWCREQGIPLTAYSPIEQGRMLDDPELKQIAARHNATSAQVALAWLVRQDKIVAIPRSSNPDHVRINRAALDLELNPDDLSKLDRAFPPPAEPTPLEML